MFIEFGISILPYVIMRLSSGKLLTLCSGFSLQANLETDMAKRVMLSIIPALSSETERHHTGGFDQKALRSAVNGAVDVIKYGTGICVDELEHYGNDYAMTRKRIEN